MILLVYSFCNDVQMKEIPRIDEEDVSALFYSEAEVDAMYEDAEEEVMKEESLSMTIPGSTVSGGPLDELTQTSGKGGTMQSNGNGFNSTI